MSAKQPNIIISTTVASFTKYLLNAPIGPDNKRRPSYTGDIEKARRFYDEQEARNCISKFIPDPGKTYHIETYQPAAINN